MSPSLEPTNLNNTSTPHTIINKTSIEIMETLLPPSSPNTSNELLITNIPETKRKPGRPPKSKQIKKSKTNEDDLTSMITDVENDCPYPMEVFTNSLNINPSINTNEYELTQNSN